jgi:hypothetical protein
MKKYLAIAAAGGALAIGVPAAFAATDAPTTTPNVPVQDATPTPDSQQQRPDREDCPEKDGQGGGGQAPNSGSSQTPDSNSYSPEI